MNFCSRVAATALLTLLAAACQKPGDPVVPMTQEQWRRVDEFMVDALPDGATPIGAMFGDNDVELVGWQLEPANLKSGQEFELTLYWQAKKQIERPWRLFTHIDGAGNRQVIDRDAASGVLPIQHWPTDRLVIDRTRRTLDNGIDGDVTIYVGLFEDEERMPIANAGQASVDPAGRLRLGTVKASWDAPTYSVHRLDGTLNLDGRIIERAWSRAPATSRWVHPVSGDRIESQHTWAKMLWDDDYLYVAVRGRDTDVWSDFTEDDDDLWEGEVFEVYLDPKNDGKNYLEIQVNPNNAVFDALFPQARNRNHRVARNHDVPGMKTAVYVQGSVNDASDRDVYWSLELRIPWSSLPDFELPPQNGSSFAVNFYRYDRNRDTDDVHTTAWSPVGAGSFHRPERFGIATLQGGPDAPVDPNTSGEPNAESPGDDSPPMREDEERPSGGATDKAGSGPTETR